MTPALLPMAGALGPAAAAAGSLSGPVRLADSVLAAGNHTGAARPCQGEWLRRPPPHQAPQLLSLPSPTASPHRLHCSFCQNLPPCDSSPPLPQADGDRRTHSTMGPRGPVLGSSHAPLFLPHGLEPETGSPLPSRLQPILLLDPSVSHTPLLTGESCCFSGGGAGSMQPAEGQAWDKGQAWDESHPSCALCCPPSSYASPC